MVEAGISPFRAAGKRSASTRRADYRWHADFYHAAGDCITCACLTPNVRELTVYLIPLQLKLLGTSPAFSTAPRASAKTCLRVSCRRIRTAAKAGVGTEAPLAYRTTVERRCAWKERAELGCISA